jgi:hypothetical protein
LVLLNADGSDCQKFYIEADVIQLGTGGEQQHNNPAVQDIIVGCPVHMWNLNIKLVCRSCRHLPVCILDTQHSHTPTVWSH